MRIVVTRPAEDAAPLAAKLEALGHEVIMVPLLAIAARADAAIPGRPWQALAVTSANGVRCLSAPERFGSIRTLTVGPQSLSAAAAAGLPAEAHGGDVEGLARFIAANLDPAAGPILYLSGAETAGDLEALLKAAGFDCHRAVLYDTVPATALGPAEDALRDGRLDAVLLYSPRTARIWRDLVEQAGLGVAAGRLLHLCLSRNVAAALPDGWRASVAGRPDEAAMLRLLEETARTR